MTQLSIGLERCIELLEHGGRVILCEVDRERWEKVVLSGCETAGTRTPLGNNHYTLVTSVAPQVMLQQILPATGGFSGASFSVTATVPRGTVRLTGTVKVIVRFRAVNGGSNYGHTFYLSY